MPFTPFHFGPGLLVKATIPGHFSLSIYALANVAMDVEPLYRMLHHDVQLHGATHTLIGAGLIGVVTALAGRSAINRAGWMYGRLRTGSGIPFHITRAQSWVGALLGTFSHLAMDAVMHEDMHPLLPFSDANPWLEVTWTQHVYLGCVIAGMLGLLLVLIRAASQSEHSLNQ